MATYNGKIMARSPFYITANAEESNNILTANLDVYIWAGSSDSRPTTPTYTINKTAKSQTETAILFDISRLVRDYFTYSRDNISVLTFDSNIVSFDSTSYSFDSGYSDSVLWVETELSITQTPDSPPTTVNDIYIALDGFGYFDEGVNPQGQNISQSYIRVWDNEDVVIPCYVNSDGVDRVDFLINGVVQSSVDLTDSVNSLESYNKVKYIGNSLDIDEVKTYNSSVLLDTIIVERVEECRYTPKKIKYYGKNGMLQQLYMFKRSDDSMSVKKENYNSILGNLGNSYIYDTGRHQIKDYNITGTESITLNSGYVNELENESFKQMLLSELVWVDNRPVSITSNSLDFEKKIDTKLFNYTINADYSNNVINNIY